MITEIGGSDNYRNTRVKSFPKMVGQTISEKVGQIGPKYSEIYVFECKNWDNKPVDKNEVIIVDAKVKEYGATKGILVGKAFTKFARIQSIQRGVDLHICKDIPDISLPGVAYAQCVDHTYGVLAKEWKFRLK